MNKTSSTGSGVPAGGRRRNQETLPAISKKTASLINKTMMSYEYQIKPNYGIFNFLLNFQKNGSEKIIPAFFESNLKNHITTMETFITIIS